LRHYLAAGSAARRARAWHRLCLLSLIKDQGRRQSLKERSPQICREDAMITESELTYLVVLIALMVVIHMILAHSDTRRRIEKT